ncbi:MAG: hypothetical protein M3N98_03760 [Actinomycetota bacterium]|nr:hypothetical protein [Actinomycetota bacterium]
MCDTLRTVPEDGSACCSTRSVAARCGIGKDTVARIWQARRVRPWKVETFKLSTDPSFESKLRDVVGLYVNPPAAAAVFCFDEQTRVQVLDRTQPSRPWVSHRNDNPVPFVWTRPANQRPVKIGRRQATLDRIPKSPTRHKIAHSGTPAAVLVEAAGRILPV